MEVVIKGGKSHVIALLMIRTNLSYVVIILTKREEETAEIQARRLLIR